MAHQEVFDFLRFVDQWQEMMDPSSPLGKHTLPLKISKGTLFLLTAHPAFSQGMSFMEINIIESIAQKFPALKGKIRSLAYIVDSSAFNTEKAKLDFRKQKQRPENRQNNFPHRYSPEYKILKQKADELFADIEDLESKELLISLYIQANFKN